MSHMLAVVAPCTERLNPGQCSQQFLLTVGRLGSLALLSGYLLALLSGHLTTDGLGLVTALFLCMVDVSNRRVVLMQLYLPGIWLQICLGMFWHCMLGVTWHFSTCTFWHSSLGVLLGVALQF